MLYKIAIIAALAVSLTGGPAWAEIERNPSSRSGVEPAETATRAVPGDQGSEEAEHPQLGTPPPLTLTSEERATAGFIASGLQDAAASLAQIVFDTAFAAEDDSSAAAAVADEADEADATFDFAGEPDLSPQNRTGDGPSADDLTLAETPRPQRAPAATPVEEDDAPEPLTVFSAGQEPGGWAGRDADELPVVMHDEPVRDVPGEELAADPQSKMTEQPQPAEPATEPVDSRPPADDPPAVASADEQAFKTSWQPAAARAGRTVAGTDRQLPGEKPQPQDSDTADAMPALPVVTEAGAGETAEIVAGQSTVDDAFSAAVQTTSVAPIADEPAVAPDSTITADTDPISDYPIDELLRRNHPARTTAAEPASEAGTADAPEPAATEPVAEPEPETTPEPEEVVEPETTPEPEEVVEPETTPEPEEVVEPETTPEPEEVVEPETTPEPEATSTLAATPEPEAATEPVAAPEPGHSVTRPAPRLGATGLARMRLPLDDGAGDPAAVAPVEPVLNLWPPKMPDYKISPKVTNISRGNNRKKQVALTFDDGPHPEFTSQLLAVLDFYDVPATFFFVGVQAQKYPQWVKMTHQSGHELASHTYDHFRLPKLPVEEKAYQIDEYQRLVEQLVGVTPRFLRPPGGQLDAETSRMLTDRGMVLALWDVAINDTQEGKTKEDTLKSALRNIRPGSIMLCHDGIQATVDMLPELITKLRAQGYQFVTMSELAAGL